jgi:hypothetical protein
MKTFSILLFLMLPIAASAQAQTYSFGTATATTQSAADNSNKVATTAYADRAASSPTLPTTTCANQFITAISASGAGTCTTATLAGAQFANQGTTTTVLHGNAAGNPSFGSVVSADLNVTGTTCTNQFLSAISATVGGTCTTATLAGPQFANQGTTTTVLHGNGSGNPSFSQVGLTTDVTGILPVANGGTGSSTGVYAPVGDAYVVGIADATLTGAVVNPTSYYGVDAAPASPNTMNDEFNGSMLNARWTVLNAVGTTSRTLANSLLTMTTQTNSVQYIYQAEPATPCEFEIKVTVGSAGGGFNYNIGFGIGDSGTVSSAKLVFFNWNSNTGAMAIDKWTNPSTFSANTSTFSIPTFAAPTLYFKVKDDGTNFTYTYSYDGLNFLAANAAISRTNFLGTPTTIGIFLPGNSSKTSVFSIEFFRRTL